jgi:hypothetical protein
MTRRSQQAIAFRSDRAAARLRLLTRDGRSQVSAIEDALDRAPIPGLPEGRSERIAAVIERAQAMVGQSDERPLTMAEFDALEYDEFGDPR